MLSVTVAEVQQAIYQQTGRSTEQYKFTLPDIKVTGTYEVQVQLHPEVVGTFNVVIQASAGQGGVRGCGSMQV